MDKDLKDKTLSELEEIAAGFGQKKYHAKYIFDFIHAKGIENISAISPLSKVFRQLLTEHGYYISALKIADRLIDPDGTIKYSFELPDGNRIESVLLFDDKRRTLCISSQVGCAMNCAFCATGKLKFRRNLTTAEIVSQVYTVEKDKCRISNVVYMGMGEPLRNYDAVLKSVRLLNHPQGKNIGIRHITISSCGDVAGINRLADEDICPRLAVSLNAPDDLLRTKLMPINAKYPLKALLRAVKNYQMITRQRVTFEYVLIQGLNDLPSHAESLARLLRGTKNNVNLIEYNSHPGCKFSASSRKVIEKFAYILENNGIETVIRQKKGRQIKAACGQLGCDRFTI